MGCKEDIKHDRAVIAKRDAHSSINNVLCHAIPFFYLRHYHYVRFSITPCMKNEFTHDSCRIIKQKVRSSHSTPNHCQAAEAACQSKAMNDAHPRDPDP